MADFRPRGDQDMTSYLREKQAFELANTGTTTINMGQPVLDAGVASAAQTAAYTAQTGEYAPSYVRPSVEQQYNIATVAPTANSQITTGYTGSDSSKWSVAQPAQSITPDKLTPAQPTVLPTTGVTVRNITAEQDFVKNWNGGKGVLKAGEAPRLPTAAEINKGVYGTTTPQFTTTQGKSAPEVIAKADATVSEIDARLAKIAETEKMLANKSAEQTQADSLTKLLTDAIGETAGQSAMLSSELAKSGGANELSQQLTGIRGEIITITAEKKSSMTDKAGQPMTLARMYGAEAELQAKYDSRIYTLTAQANSLMGNIAQAKEDAQSAVDAKYGPIKERQAIYQAQLTALQSTLTAQEKVKADAIQITLDEEKQALADKKAEDTKIQNAWLDAINAGIRNTKVLDSIKNSKTTNEALGILGANMPDSSVEAMRKKYLDAGILATDSLAIATAKMKNSRIYQDEVRGPAGGTGTADNYFTRPKADGKIGYYFGNEKQPATAQEISQDQYNAGAYKTTPGESPEDKQIAEFQKQAKDLVPKLLGGEMQWGVAWDTLHTNYPQASADTINSALGGGIPYDPITGKFDTTKAWGTAIKAKK